MNISELSRKLKIDPNRLRGMLPQMGFDVGRKAIKMDDRTARHIINNWRTLFREWELEYVKKEEEEEKPEIAPEERKEIRIPKIITVREFANRIDTPVNTLMKILMKNGILASLNDKIDFDSAMIIGDDLGWQVLPLDEDANLESGSEETIRETIRKSGTTIPRPPVIVVMGHVDHGKTKILDAIRSTNVMGGEAGGITQHIGAYEVEKNGRNITFIDTPGHEAFTAMRSRGAKIADIAIVVVAADDGVQPQTREVIDIVNAAKLPFVVAINKIDKESADLERVKRELAELNLIPEDWGGKTICVPVSAKMGKGIDDLLETLLLVADMQKEDLVADPKGDVVASVIESHIDKLKGVLSTVLVQNGTLKINDYLKIGNVLYGRVRSMENWKSEKLNEAGPSVPVRVLGLKLAPEVGDVLLAVENLKGLEKDVKRQESGRPFDIVYEKNKSEDNTGKDILKIILKTDVLGSAEALLGSLEQFKHSKVGIKVIHSGLGNITEADIDRALSAEAIIYGFNVRIDSKMEEIAREKNVEIEAYQIIYDLLDSVKARLEKKLENEIKRIDYGKLKILAIFKRDKDEQIVGGKVLEGKVVSDSKFDLMRQNVKIGKGEISQLQSGKQDVRESVSPNECGMKTKIGHEIHEGDILLIYKEEFEKVKIEM
ncbi:translation initiation factor IF-2 [Patescibacteria group bacterium]|nr:translation initiation factor IF-2 [Patescibacteria group bacterium]